MMYIDLRKILYLFIALQITGCAKFTALSLSNLSVENSNQQLSSQENKDQKASPTSDSTSATKGAGKADNILLCRRLSSGDTEFRPLKSFAIPENTDHLFEKQWYLEQMHVPEAWQYFGDFKNAPKIKIAVLEEGKFCRHLDFSGSLSSIVYWTDGDLDDGAIQADDGQNVYYSSSDIQDLYVRGCPETQLAPQNIPLHRNTKAATDTLNPGKADLNPREILQKGEPISASDLSKEHLSKYNQEAVQLALNLNPGIVGSTEPKGVSYPAGGRDIQQYNHATAVTGLIASAHNNFGIKGVCPSADIIPVSIRFDYSNQAAPNYTSPQRFVRAIAPLLERVQPDIVNVSREFKDLSPELELFMRQEIVQTASAHRRIVGERKRETDIPIVIAAGNSKASIDDHFITEHPFIPIGASTLDGGRAEYNSNGSKLRLYAPGAEEIYDSSIGNQITSTSIYMSDEYLNRCDILSGGYRYSCHGTSMSSPLVAGVIALMKSVNPYLTVSDIYSMLDNRDSVSHNTTSGLVNAEDAVKRSFRSVLELWRDDWQGMWQPSSGPGIYYNKDSIIVRGVVAKSGNSVRYIIYSDKKATDFPSEIVEILTSHMKAYPWVNINIDQRVRPLSEFLDKMNGLPRNYGRISVDLEFNDTQLSPSNCQVNHMQIEFKQKYSAWSRSETDISYQDYGSKFLSLKRNNPASNNSFGDWVVEKEIWFFEPHRERGN